MYRGNYDNEGKYISFYTSDIHGDNIPSPNIELTEAEWQEALTGNYKVINDKHTYCEPISPTTEEIKHQDLFTLDEKYQPQFADLSQALNMAILAENSVLIASIKIDYMTLKTEYDTKRGEIDG